ncbi:MAG: hypothetical protein OXI26_04245 [bacterium]|nr:hypothetical protein [bacterium]
MMVNRLWRLALHAVRWGLVAMLVGGLIADLERLDGKGWLVRTLTFPLCIAVAPLLSRWSERRIAYYTSADTCIVAPFFLDIGGNMLGLYESVELFDDILHLANWALLAVAFTMILRGSRPTTRLGLVAAGGGFGAFLIVLWEVLEFVVAKTGTSRLFLTYEDTVIDLALSTGGGVVGAAIVAFLVRSRLSERSHIPAGRGPAGG